MSKSFGPNFNVHTFSAVPYSPQNVSYSSVLHNSQSSWSLPGALPSQPITPTRSNGSPKSPAVTLPPKKPVKLKKRTEEELEITRKAAERFSARLVQDHFAVLHPDVDTPFADKADVIRRLLPYHIYCHPHDDLELVKGTKGKQKAADVDLKEEIEETRFALECHKRYEKLRFRFRRAQRQTASRASPDGQAYVLAQAVLEADRVDASLLSNELKAARNELERLEREKRTTATTSAKTQYAAHATPTIPTLQAQYYRPYPYAYTQAYGTAPPTTSTFQVNPPSGPNHNRVNTAIPVQLPVASLPALHALGIHPVPATSITEGQTPPAVLRGSTANGTMLTLEINVSLLQSAQMSGLAMVLNSLMSRTSSGGAASLGTSTGTTPGPAVPTPGAQTTSSSPTGGDQRPPVIPSSELDGSCTS